MIRARMSIRAILSNSLGWIEKGVKGISIQRCAPSFFVPINSTKMSKTSEIQ